MWNKNQGPHTYKMKLKALKKRKQACEEGNDLHEDIIKY